MRLWDWLRSLWSPALPEEMGPDIGAWIYLVDDYVSKGRQVPILPEPYHTLVEEKRPGYWRGAIARPRTLPGADRPPRRPGLPSPPPRRPEPLLGASTLSIERSSAALDAEASARALYEIFDEWYGDVSGIEILPESTIGLGLSAAERILNVKGKPLLSRPVISGEYRERQEVPLTTTIVPISLPEGLQLHPDDSAFKDLFLWVRSEYRRLGYAWFETGNFNLNVGGIRLKGGPTDAFCDAVFVAWLENGVWRFRAWKATTKPGGAYLRDPDNSAGTGILAPGQYRGCHVIGDHKDSYTALVQLDRDVTVHRDKDHDSVAEEDGPAQTGRFGMNVHTTDHDPWDKEPNVSTVVGKWSAMCQVVASSADFVEFMRIIFRAAAVYGPRFTYTLLVSTSLSVPTATKRVDYSGA